MYNLKRKQEVKYQGACTGSETKMADISILINDEAEKPL